MKFLKMSPIGLCIAIILCSCSLAEISDNPINVNELPSPFYDERGKGYTYPVVKIGQQYWMAENLQLETVSSICYLEDVSNCKIYGRLYSSPTDLCPTGWHVPTDEDWQDLFDHLGGKSLAGGKLKSVSDYWDRPNAGATNISGFNALPGGFARTFLNNFQVRTEFKEMNREARFWTATQSSQAKTFRHFSLSVRSMGVKKVDSTWENFPIEFYSCRCVMDQ
ncbi:MAG: FISUMP domain-containing protein [Saprospiraceae bacterium]